MFGCGSDRTDSKAMFVARPAGKPPKKTLMNTVFPSDPFRDGCNESLLDAYGRVIHMYR